jgi:hypothetical protein
MKFRRIILVLAVILPVVSLAATASFIFTTPVAQANRTGVQLGDTFSISVISNQARVPYMNRTASGVIPGTNAELVVTLTEADISSILAVITSRAIANGQPLPAGSMSVVP